MDLKSDRFTEMKRVLKVRVVPGTSDDISSSKGMGQVRAVSSTIS